MDLSRLKSWLILFILFLALAAFVFASLLVPVYGQSYKIVDTGQNKYYNNLNEISAPSAGENFYGQDAQIEGYQPSYTDNGNGTITDNVTGLMWSKSPDLNNDGVINIEDKLSYSEALTNATSFSLAGYNDWRLPTIKELYSLIMFTGIDPSGYNGSEISGLTPFINTDYFEFGYGDVTAGERIIDAQFATSTLYVSTTMNNEETMFGVNFADGRIKGYPTGPMPGQSEDKGYYILYVRGNTNYGINSFIDNGDGTINDESTGLMWAQNDNSEGLNWQQALSWVKQKNSENYLGYSDWRLPNIKELQSIVDYSRSPATTNSAAIDPVFDCSTIVDEGGNTNYPFYWSGTTHANMVGGSSAAYVAFGEGLGWMEMPPMSGNYSLLDVHGAGCQRSDPKQGNPDDYPWGHGPQGDVIRIYNYVRLVRDASTTSSIGENNDSKAPGDFSLEQNYPNPFNPATTISFSIPAQLDKQNSRTAVDVKLTVYDSVGRSISTLVNEQKEPGFYQIVFNSKNISSGVYFYLLTAGSYKKTMKMICIK